MKKGKEEKKKTTTKPEAKPSPKPSATLAAEKPKDAELKPEKPVVSDEATLKPSVGKRNNDKFTFNGEQLGKGKLVLFVIKAYLEKNKKISFSELQEAFPDSLHPSKQYGIIREFSEAKKISKGRDRYFMNDVLLTGDKKKAVVTNQWSSEYLNFGFLKHAKSLGFKIS